MSATVIVIGDLSKDAEEKSGKSGNLYAVLEVVNAYTPFGKDETYRNFYRCVCFGDVAKRVGQLPKGTLVAVIGSLEASNRKSETNDKTYLNLSVTASSVEIISGAEEEYGGHIPEDDAAPF